MQSIGSFARYASILSLAALGFWAGCASEDASGSRADDDGSANAGGNDGTGGFDVSTGPGGEDAGGAGEGGADIFDCAEDISTASLDQLPADLIVAVDNSASMALEAAEVKAHMNTLVGALTATGIDAHLVVISKPSDNTIFDMFDAGVCLPAPVGSGNCPDDENLPIYRHVEQEVASHDALSQIINTYDQWKDSLRPNASKTFLVVSDDESAMTAQEFTAALAALPTPITDFKFDALVASQDSIASCALCAITGCAACLNPCCDKSLQCLPISQEKGQTYMDLQAQTGGVYGDLCTQNFAPVLTDMAEAVIEHTQISCDFKLPDPSNGTVVPSKTNVDFIATPGAGAETIYNVGSEFDCTINGGWYFDNANNPSEISLCDSTCTLVKESTEGTLRVKYGCTTETVPN